MWFFIRSLKKDFNKISQVFFDTPYYMMPFFIVMALLLFTLLLPVRFILLGSFALKTMEEPAIVASETPSLSLSLSSDAAVLNITPTASGSFDSTSITASVTTDNVSGYQLTLAANTDALTGETASIPTLATTASEADFPSNHFGYKIGSDTTDYLPVPLENTIVGGSAGPVLSDPTDVILGAKVSTAIASGTYSGVSIMFMATANLPTDPEIPTDPNTDPTDPTDPTDSNTEPTDPDTPSSDDSTSLYYAISALSQGDFDVATINDAISTDNSGVFTYTGEHSDAGTEPIYFYRGILDSSFADTYGSSGDGALTPNYVKLTKANSGTDSGSASSSENASPDTCWRILRTTGTGGVKLIYNGLWTDSTCAHSGEEVFPDESTVYYNRTETYADVTDCIMTSSENCGTLGRITYAGYNYNVDYAYPYQVTTSTDNSVLFNNDTASHARATLEAWYASTFGYSTIDAFESSAGYCNDRTIYDTSGTALSSTVPFVTSANNLYYFGAHLRLVSGSTPSLTCTNTTTHDLLDQNLGKSFPVALLTADEAALAGAGYKNTEASSTTSFITSGAAYWTLSPNQFSLGVPSIFAVSTKGELVSQSVFTLRGLRPVISLTKGTHFTSGTGTATSPWVVKY